jgi:phospholipase A1
MTDYRTFCAALLGLGLWTSGALAQAVAPASQVQRCWLDRVADERFAQSTAAQIKADCAQTLKSTQSQQAVPIEPRFASVTQRAPEPALPALSPAPSREQALADTQGALRAAAAAAQAAKSLSEFTEAEANSVITRRMASELRANNERFALLPHRQNYFLPASYHRREMDSPTERARSAAYRSTEAQFQVSFKFPVSRPLFNDRVVPFFAYTGKAWWQIYDASRSRPFREYNHEPELLLGTPISGLQAGGWTLRMATLGFNHQSNGQAGERSRSWNRLVGEVYADHGSASWASLKLWHRLNEKTKTSAADTAGDDNPDISRYMGRFELRAGHVRAQGHQFTAMVRKSFAKNGKGALQLDWSHPDANAPGLRYYATFFDGYGDSLIDHDRRVRRLGAGIMLNDWF